MPAHPLSHVRNIGHVRNVRNVGLNAITINEGDELIEVQITSGDDEIILATGSTPWLPEVQGADKPHVFTARVGLPEK